MSSKIKDMVLEKPTVRELLKEATKLKKEKKYDEACDKLKEAYSSAGSDDEITITDRLRLPMFLQLEGKSKEGWKVINELNKEFTDAISQEKISNQMRIFLQKDKKHHLAVVYGAWSICTEIDREQYCLDSVAKGVDDSAGMDRIEHIKSELYIKQILTPLLKKAKLQNELDRISLALFNYINSNEEYDFLKVSVIAFSKAK